MKHTLLAAAGLAALVVSPAVASAQDSGWYIRGNLGAGQFTDADIENNLLNGANVLNDTNIETESDGDVAGSLGLGYEFGNNWRLELDGNYLRTDLDVGFGNTGNLDGDLRTNALMLNAIYDFDLNSRWAPYLGAGLGFVTSHFDLNVPNAALQPLAAADCDPNCNINDRDTNFGAQFLAGLGYDISSRLTWDTHYRYQYAGEPEFDGINQGVNRGRFVTELDEVASHSVLTGLRYRFGGDAAAPAAAAAAATVAALPSAPLATYDCWDGTIGYSEACCAEPPVQEVAQTYTCWDGAIVYDLAQCAPQPVPEVTTYSCWDNSVVTDLNQCPQVPVAVASYNNCGPSSVAIFDVDVTASPKPLNRLGTLPEFGDSHDLTATQFYEKLQAKYAANENSDRAYLNYLFRSMGYTNGFRDADAYMFSDETLPVGTSGILGSGEAHNYGYYVLPNSDRDRQAFRIQSANGSVIHFMKTCGNYMYACN